MRSLRDEGLINELGSSAGFGYVLSRETDFATTDYKVLQNQTDDYFVSCVKLTFNGQIELFYLTESFRSLNSCAGAISPDVFVNIIASMFNAVIAVKRNGFLSCEHLVLDWDKVFVDPATNQIKLVYLPIAPKLFDDSVAFENELRSEIVRLINSIMTTTSPRIDSLVQDLFNANLSIEEIFNRLMTGGAIPRPTPAPSPMPTPTPVPMPHPAPTPMPSAMAPRMVAMGANKLEIPLGSPRLVLGKNPEKVDYPIQFNPAISRVHCEIRAEGGQLLVVDLNSVNGTFVNGMRIAPNQPTPIHVGDIVRLADSDFRIV